MEMWQMSVGKGMGIVLGDGTMSEGKYPKLIGSCLILSTN